LRIFEQQIETKKTELVVLEEKSKELDEREKDLAKKLQDIAVREADLTKEIMIDRERKDRLAASEAELKRRQDKIQRFLNE
jgi:coenzyme F420-reducing hydrogenase delta subunit